jgi:MoxR-like ATPase
MCGRFLIPLDRPTQAEPKVLKKVHEHFASTCGSYGEPMPPTPEEARLTVAFPDPDRQVNTQGTPNSAAVQSCSGCAHFVRDDAVAREFGWVTGMCSAKGKLVLTNRQTYEARDCDFRTFGAPRTETDGITLFPEYADDFGAYDPVKDFINNLSSGPVDPLSYESDAPVTEAEQAEGVQAWRKIEDPETGNSTLLPIFRPSYFDEDMQALIPKTGDPEHPENYVDHFRGVYLAAVCWQELDETPALWGQAGTGKTELFRHLAWLMQLPFRRISITGSTELDDLAGKMRFNKEQGTYFQYGRLPMAWSHPGVICIDEPNTGAPDVWQFIRPLTDNSKQLVLDMNKGEVIKRHDSAYLGMAMNPSWDVKNVGTIEIGDADANRLFHVYVDLPPEKLEREIIKARVKLDGWELSGPQMDMLMGVARDLRALVVDGSLPISWAIRPQIKVARALRWFDTVTAYRRAVADYLEPATQDIILDVVRSHAS